MLCDYNRGNRQNINHNDNICRIIITEISFIYDFHISTSTYYLFIKDISLDFTHNYALEWY